MADSECFRTTLPDVAGHRFTLHPDGPERLETLVALINGAQTSLRLLYYIFTSDGVSQRVRDALAEAAGRGVDVALLIDGFGSEQADDEFLAPIEAAGGRFFRYEAKRSRRYLLRNHQKMAIADERKALIGGFNVEYGYFAPYGEGWRDLGIGLEGPAVKRLARYFDALFEWSLTPGSKMRGLRAILLRHSEQDGPVRWLLGGPTRELSPWAQALNNDLASADRLDMIAAYFAPYGALMRRICDIAKRDHARIVTAAKSDNQITIAAARNRYQYLLPSVDIYEYQPSRLHTKLFVVGDSTYIGSANCDVRSLYLNLEIMLRIRDAVFAAAMRRYIDGEVADSKPITEQSYYAKRTLWRRIKGRFAYILMSVIDYNVSRRLNFGLDGR